MRYELHRPGTAGVTPLVNDVEPLDRPKHGSTGERDEAIIQLLREKLKDRGQGNSKDTQGGAPTAGDSQGEDKYEPQRLSRKIVWQYDSAARKVPLLRRPYI